MTAILRNVPKTFTFEEQRIEINEIALDLYNLQLGNLELTDFSVVKPNPAASGSGDVTYDNTTGEFTYTPPDLSNFITSIGDAIRDADFTTAGLMKTDGAGNYSVITDNSTDWNNAASWGDHKLAGYLKSNGTYWDTNTNAYESSTLDLIGNVTLTNIQSDHYLKWNGTAWVNTSITIPAAQVQVDWNQTDINHIEYIKNKPTLVENINDLGDVDTTGITNGKILKSDSTGNWIIADETDTTYSEFTGTDAGLVPASTLPVVTKFLRSDGVWADTPNSDTNTTYQIDSSTENVNDVKITLLDNNSNSDSVIITKGNNITFDQVTTSGFRISATGGSGGGATDFTDLGDTPNNLTANKWLRVNSGGASLEFIDGNLVDLNDFNLTVGQGNTAETDQVVQWNGSAWTNATLDLPSLLSDLTDVSNAVPGPGQVLKWDDGNQLWKPSSDLTSSGSGISLTDISLSKLPASDTPDLDYDNQTGTFEYTPFDTKFTKLSDTPSTLTAGKYLKVNAGGTALEYVDNTFTNLTDTPSSLTANKWLKVNATGTALEYTDAPSGGGGGANVTISDTEPSSPSTGDLWWASDEGQLKIYYDDGVGTPSVQWVDTGGVGGGTAGTDNYVTNASLTGTDLVLTRSGGLANITADLSSLGGGGGTTQDLQDVTDEGKTTTNDITAAGFTSNGDVIIDYDSSASNSSGDIKFKDGSGVKLTISSKFESINSGTNWINRIKSDTVGSPLVITGGKGAYNNSGAATVIGFSGGLMPDIPHLIGLDDDYNYLTELYGGGTKVFTTQVDGVQPIGALYDKDDEKGTAGQILSSTGTAIDWIDNRFTTLLDTPSSLTADKWLKVNSGGTALEWADAPSSGATSGNTYVTYLNGQPRWSEQTAANSYQESISYQTASNTGPGGVDLTPLCDGNGGTYVNMGCGHADMSFLWLSQAALTDVVKITIGFDGHGWIGYGSNSGISTDSSILLRVDNGQPYGANGVTGSPTEIILYDNSTPIYSGQLQTLTFVEYPDANGTGGSNRGPGSRCHVYYFKITRSVDNVLTEITYSAGALTDGDKGDITVSNSGSTWNIDASTVGTTELSATGTKDNTTFLRGDNTWATAGGASYTIEALLSPGIKLVDSSGNTDNIFFDGSNGITVTRTNTNPHTIEFDGGSAGMATANVKSFGAKGDDSTDDTAAIQNAINSLTGSGVGKGGIVYLPPGIYRISSALTFGNTANAITLKGSSTHFPIMNNGGSIIRVTNTSGINAIEINNASSIAITNLGIDHASSSSGTAIKATSTTSKQGVTIDQVYILDHSKGIELNGYANSIIKNSEIRDQPDNANSTHAILLKKGSDARQDQLRMENVIVEGLVGGSTRHQYSKGLLVEDWTNSLWIKDCCFLRNKYGIYFDQSMGGETADAAAFHRIENCDVDQNDADGVFIDGGYSIWVQNCYLSSNINCGLVTGENFKGTMWINSPDCRGNNLYGMAFNVNHNKIQINSPHIADNGSAQPAQSAGIQVLDGADDISIMGGFIGGNVFGQHVNSGNQQIGIRFVGSTHNRININGVDVTHNISGGIEWMLAGQNVSSTAMNFIQNCAGYSTGQTTFP